MYKLGLFQSGARWEWFLQQVIPVDMPFSQERSRYYGSASSIREAIQKAHEWVPREEVEYVYLDRQESTLKIA